MEAIRPGTDIEAQSPEGVVTSYEVKFFGMEDADFQVLLASMRNGPTGGAISLYQPLNYLIFRVYQASLQLASACGQREVVIVIDGLAWFRFDMQVSGGWINWVNPAFMQVDQEWQSFMGTQLNGGPSDADLRKAISQIDRVKVYQQDAAFEFKKELDEVIP
jgi:hypothetical protein